MSNIQIVKLLPEEWQLYKQLRLEALLMEPQAFASQYENTVKKPDSDWQEGLAEVQVGEKNWLLFAKENDRLIGMIGAYQPETSDVVVIVALYVTKDKRGQGVAAALMEAILAEVGSKGIFRKAELAVNTDQISAIALYTHFGFKFIEEKTGVMGNGNSCSEYMMEKELSHDVGGICSQSD
jgi:ribosomal protein S18 acetylase RimI-like enzyme